MTSFLAAFAASIVLVGAAFAALALGALRGRPLARGCASAARCVPCARRCSPSGADPAVQEREER